jgi:Mycothiol maleylpyruvate isomerase N-terminal domain
MVSRERTGPGAVEDAPQAVYQNITTVADGLGEADLMRPSRCPGWAVGDILDHQILDARRRGCLCLMGRA